ncbi:MAG: sulfite exporter TauE/SafE family protein [Sandaracinaceae bacterium]
MDIELALLAFCGVVTVGYAVQTITGFGALLVCVTLGSLFMDLRAVLTLGVPISILQTLYIAIRRRDEVQWRLLFTRVLPAMMVGVAIGYVTLSPFGDTAWVKRVFGALVCLLATRELWRMHASDTPEPTTLHPLAGALATLAAGVIHGVYGTGGPLLVYALGKTELSKSQLRSTLSTVWLTLNTGLAVAFAFDGRYDGRTMMDLAVVLPGVAVGVLVGEWVHKRVNERTFRKGMFTLLLVAALALIARA